MITILMWGGAAIALSGLLWLASRFTHQPTYIEQYDGYLPPPDLLTLVIEELDHPTVMGYFLNAEQAHLRAFKLLTGGEYVANSEWPTVADWFKVTPGVHVAPLTSARVV